MKIISVIFKFSWIFTEKIWMLLQSTVFRSFFLFPEYFWTINMDDALLNVIPVIFAFSWIFSEKIMDVASINFIPVIFAFSWIFLDNKYGQCFIERHSGHFCILLNILKKHWCCFKQSHSRHFCFLLNIFFTTNIEFFIFAVWIFLIDIASIKLIFVFSWEKYSPFKSRTIVESIKTKRKT